MVTDEVYCADSNLYHVDSCGNLTEHLEQCPCGCSPDHTACENCGCTPDCSGRECGPDGCGASCGKCPTGESCSASGQCVASCTPDCSGKECGPDGCGGSCGRCPSGESCNQEGQCDPDHECSTNQDCLDLYGEDWYCDLTLHQCKRIGCTPDCSGKECGPDGCGGTCGTCPAGQTCSGGQCVSSGGDGDVCDPCSSDADCLPGYGCFARPQFPDVTWCSNPCSTDDDCNGGSDMYCHEGYCQPSIILYCHNGDVWAEDGCEHILGMVEDCGPNEICEDGKCVGQGDNCDPCVNNQDCKEGYACLHWIDYPEIYFCSAPCSSDAQCPEEVMTCPNGDYCTPGWSRYCVGDMYVLFDDCGNELGDPQEYRECVDDHLLMCENSSLVRKDCVELCHAAGYTNYSHCGYSEEYECDVCVCNNCTPSCEGKECGDDGCGGSCGTCSYGLHCVNGECCTNCSACLSSCSGLPGCCCGSGCMCESECTPSCGDRC